ncbi:MAG TPA: nucleoside hydrolase-like domain-containing protein [Bryobacteraceae bacterium]|nr:nucleoside hydrolase-like domain-containing protein [Bryobacteraceae bacterium]
MLRRIRCTALFLCVSTVLFSQTKPRLIVFTDIGGDPDDQQSMVRLLSYANEFEIEGLIASAAGIPGELKENVVRPDLIRQMVAAYGHVRPNLERNKPGFPSAGYLETRIKSGNPKRGVENIGAGKDTEGSNWIIKVVDRDDPRPVNVAIWGGATELAQALWRVRNDRGAAGVSRFAAKLRVHSISHQDNTGPWIVENFPELFFILNAKAAEDVLRVTPSGPDRRLSSYRGMYLGGDESLTSREWIDTNVRHNHGPLGALYPPKTWTVPNPHSALKEGDTPSWFYFLANGLSDPAHPEWGGWGGRFLPAGGGLYRDAVDTVDGVIDARATVWRWRPAFQNDFAARMDWSVQPPDKANHNPIAVLNGNRTQGIVKVEVSSGAPVTLSAAGSADPDGDRLSFRWFLYPEAGTYKGAVPIENAEEAVARIVAPGVQSPATVHVILKVRDGGTPALYAYRRAILTVQPKPKAAIAGERKLWHKITITFDGPSLSEEAMPNPFRDYRLNVMFTHTSTGVRRAVPGYFAADGNAAESSASAGNKWRVNFSPDLPGEWRYQASFRRGTDVATSLDVTEGEAAGFDGASGTFRVAAAGKPGNDFRSKGVLRYTGEHYLRHAETGERFLKGGADSPENFLAYADFDGTFDTDARVNEGMSARFSEPFIHHYEPHAADWTPGDPSWKNGKGKNIVGALNYLASKGMNSVYFLTYNVDGGDGKDVWMWTSPGVRDRYDVSKLEQWEIVFSHMTSKGLLLHVVTQETENDRKLGGGPGLNPVRRLYYRELVAHFSHHPAIVWNLGEENNTSDADRKEIAAYLRALDPYAHPITVHTHNNKAPDFYNGVLGDSNFEAASIQGDMRNYYRDAVVLRERSAKVGRKWAIFGDEQPSADVGVMPDESDPGHDIPRIHALWGNLLGGGSGVEWYFGYKYPHMDLNCEDWRSRDRMWDQTRHALTFFHRHLPFWEMEPDNSLASSTSGARVFAKRGEVYAVQLPGGTGDLSVPEGRYTVSWYNPRTGGDLVAGSVAYITGPGSQSLGSPPSEPERDWIVLVKKR